MAPWLGKIIIQLAVDKIRSRIKEKRMFKGKLTYTMLAAWGVSIAARVLGDGVVTEADLTELFEAGAALVAVYGRWRASRG